MCGASALPAAVQAVRPSAASDSLSALSESRGHSRLSAIKASPSPVLKSNLEVIVLAFVRIVTNLLGQLLYRKPACTVAASAGVAVGCGFHASLQSVSMVPL